MTRHQGDTAIGLMDRANAVSPRHRFALLAGYGIGPVFLLLAAWFLFGPDGLDIPSATDDHAMGFAEHIRAGTLRSPRRPDPPVIVSGGYELSCMECHRLFQSASPNKTPFGQHTDIVLDHGMNDRCLNCHDHTQREKLRLTGGEEIAFAEAPRLCATCHGTTYRDWQRGMHGRTTGSWIAASADHRRLTCTECHNPHAPAFQPMTPFPGPNTLRMKGAPRHDGEHQAPNYAPSGKQSPLRSREIEQDRDKSFTDVAFGADGGRWSALFLPGRLRQRARCASSVAAYPGDLPDYSQNLMVASSQRAMFQTASDFCRDLPLEVHPIKLEASCV